MPKKHSQKEVLGKKLKTNAPTVVQSLAQFFSSPKTSALVSQIFAKATRSQSQNLLVMTAISRFPRAPCAFSLPVAPFFCNSRRLPPSHLPGHVGRAARQRRVPSIYGAPPSRLQDLRHRRSSLPSGRRRIHSVHGGGSPPPSNALSGLPPPTALGKK